jgi:hypothetical protein
MRFSRRFRSLDSSLVRRIFVSREKKGTREKDNFKRNEVIH